MLVVVCACVLCVLLCCGCGWCVRVVFACLVVVSVYGDVYVYVCVIHLGLLLQCCFWFSTI